MRGQYTVNNSSLIPLKYFYFLTLSLSTKLYLSHYDMSLKIPLLKIVGYFIHKYAHTAISTSLLSNWWHPKCGFSDPKLHSSFFYLGSKTADRSHCPWTALCDEIFKFL